MAFDPTNSTDLKLSVSAGQVWLDGAGVVAVAASTVALVANSTNYVYVDIPSQSVLVNQTGFPVTSIIPVAVAVTSNVRVISLTDSRPSFTSAPGSVLVAKFDATAQQANISPTTVFSVPANGAGMYRASIYIVETQAATTSSTLPGVQVLLTDADTNVAETILANGGNSGNTVGSLGTPNQYGFCVPFNAKAGTNIQIATTAYASSGATPMQYAVRVKLEYLGN